MTDDDLVLAESGAIIEYVIANTAAADSLSGLTDQLPRLSILVSFRQRHDDDERDGRRDIRHARAEGRESGPSDA
ncbi:MAG: hypothetical protein QOG17_2038, partial [Gammaproteobacteria bacterium]|nr:hypothetical protein [Gammaproteobacteria bacterium]